MFGVKYDVCPIYAQSPFSTSRQNYRKVHGGHVCLLFCVARSCFICRLMTIKQFGNHNNPTINSILDKLPVSYRRGINWCKFCNSSGRVVLCMLCTCSCSEMGRKWGVAARYTCVADDGMVGRQTVYSICDGTRRGGQGYMFSSNDWNFVESSYISFIFACLVNPLDWTREEFLPLQKIEHWCSTI